MRSGQGRRIVSGFCLIQTEFPYKHISPRQLSYITRMKMHIYHYEGFLRTSSQIPSDICQLQSKTHRLVVSICFYYSSRNIVKRQACIPVKVEE